MRTAPDPSDPFASFGPSPPIQALDPTPPNDRLEPDLALAHGPGWFDSSWDLRRGCDVRERWADAGVDPGGERHARAVAQRRPVDTLISRRTASPRSTTAIA